MIRSTVWQLNQSTLLTDGSAPLSVKMANARSQTHRTEADTRGDEALKSRADLEQKLKAGGAQATWRHLWPHLRRLVPPLHHDWCAAGGNQRQVEDDYRR
jgi:hypothetical protein